MRACPDCQTEYPDDVEVCPRDGRALDRPSSVPVTAAHLGEAPTLPSLPAFAAADGGAGSLAVAVAVTTPPHPVSDPRAIPDAVDRGPSALAATSESFDSLVGATLAGRYQIVRRIGEGGMGAVYEAKHTIIGKRVAVKVLLEKFLAKSDFVARLLQEARLASAIGHEHIVDVTDFGTTDDGRAFVAMEFLEGESLAQLVMREAPLPVERSLRIARQVASALGAAHAKGIVHRDVKPENVYLIRRGESDFVKVVDFGISKAVKQGQGDDTPDYHLTHTGLLLGTPLYMSPEQARGDEDLDHRVDVWAMGVLLYECLTGEVPFRANNYLGIISQVLTHTALPPSKLRPELGIPEAVEAVVMRAMEKDRDRRYAQMSDVEHDLERLLAGDQNVGAGMAVLPSTAPPPRNAARGRIWVWGAAVAALVSGVALVLARPDPSAGPVPAGAVVPVRAEAAPPPTDTPAPAATVTKPPASPTNDRDPGAAPVAVQAAAEVRTTPQRRIRRRANATIRPSGETSAAGTGAPATFGNPSGGREDPVIRGVLPSRSGEGYPDN